MNDNRAKASNAPPLLPQTGTNFTTGDGKKTITQRATNADVLTTLVRLSGGPNYGYNQQAWRTWQESHLQAEAVDRRIQ